MEKRYRTIIDHPEFEYTRPPKLLDATVVRVCRESQIDLSSAKPRKAQEQFIVFPHGQRFTISLKFLERITPNGLEFSRCRSFPQYAVHEPKHTREDAVHDRVDQTLFARSKSYLHRHADKARIVLEVLCNRCKTVIGPGNRHIRIYEHEVVSLSNPSSSIAICSDCSFVTREAHDPVGVSFSDFACPVAAAVVRDDEFVVDV